MRDSQKVFYRFPQPATNDSNRFPKNLKAKDPGTQVLVGALFDTPLADASTHSLADARTPSAFATWLQRRCPKP